MKTIQYFSQQYLEACSRMSVREILEYLEQFRLLQAPPVKTKLISIKIPENLLAAFKTKSGLQSIRYQTKIKKLMQDWVEEK